MTRPSHNVVELQSNSTTESRGEGIECDNNDRALIWGRVRKSYDFRYSKIEAHLSSQSSPWLGNEAHVVHIQSPGRSVEADADDGFASFLGDDD